MTKSKLEFQIYDYRETHQTFEDDESDSETLGEYIIQVFGRTMDGKSVYAKLKDFQPRFFIKVPDNWTKRHSIRIEKFLKSSENRKVWKNYRSCLMSCGIVKRKKAYGFTNNKEFKFICLTFNNSYACKKFAALFELGNVYIPGVTTRPKKFEVYEANLTPMLRCFHIQDIPGCGWVEANNYDTVTQEKDKESICNYELIISYKDLKSIKKESNAPFKICSFDIECDSCDGMFPQANRPNDNIIQIGCTYTYLGKSEPYREYISVLNSCDNIEGATVNCLTDERDLLLDWMEEVKKSDADILTGYNIFYFDEKYIYDRSKYLGIEYDMKYLSKLKTYQCPFKEQKLASSALGENLLRYYDTPGLIHIDLMKDVQKTYNLSSYKLDKVASNFIKGNITQVKKKQKNKYDLVCNHINDLNLNDYIHIELMESFVSEDIGDKFKVLKLDKENKIITIHCNFDLVDECDFNRGKIYWSQAKDDVPPKEIFRMHKEDGSSGRCIIAKYCLKDCRLVNLLINKLEVVTKNIEMANVCYVPLSYLFVRGQGIKLFSLCLKDYRKFGYLFPVVRKPEEELGSYEGAIVFDPIPNVSYQAYAVKDYASLYPSSIIHKNMSHETKVVNDDYDNLPGITYFNAKFKDNDGNIQYRRFAKTDEFGVVPTILRTLLSERKAVKKQMKTEKDPFKYAILDAKQSALKVTANSLYGQLGASTSPIRERDIAACTTSTGREMLILAKKYDEEILPWIINGLQKAYKKGDQKTIDYIYKKEIKNFNDEELKEKIRKYCKKTEKYVFNPIIKYGDSVTGDTPILVRDIYTNKIYSENISHLTNKYYSDQYHGDKEIAPITNLEVWSDSGWTKIKNVIRHRLESHKKILQVNTGQSIVNVTDEHSLLDEYGNEIDAKYVKVGKRLLHCIPEFKIDNMYNINTLLNVGELRIYNSCNALDYYCYLVNNNFIRFELEYDIYNKEYIFRYNKNIQGYQENVKSIKEIKYHNYEYVYDLTTESHHFHAGVGSIIVHNTDSIFSCYQFRDKIETVEISDKINLFKKIIEFGKKLIIPFIPKEYQDEFQVLYEKHYGNIKSLKLPKTLKPKPKPQHWKIILPISDRFEQFLLEYIEESYFPWLWTLHDIFTQDLSYLSEKQQSEILDVKLFNHGFLQIEKMRLKTTLFSDTKKKCIINIIKNFCKDVLKDNYLIPYWKYNSKKNILECRMDFKTKGYPIRDKRNLDESIELGVISGDLIKSRLAFPHDLEYEKTFWPYLILTKKRYVGNKYEFDREKYKLDYMGIVLKRRDNSPIVKEICSGIISKLIEDRDPEGAYQFLEESLNKMFNGEYNIKYFLTSKTLKMKESYADWTRIAHVVLSERIGDRDLGNKPQAGDRISFAAVEVPQVKGMLQGDRIETPEYIKENNLKIDYYFYLTNQIEKPALQFLKLAVPTAERRLEDFKIRMNNKRKGIADIFNYLSSNYNSNDIKDDYTKPGVSDGSIGKSLLDNLISSKLYDF